MFKGSMVALVTPMNLDDSINQQALISLLEWHLQEKTAAIIIAGTTGEGATLTEEEKFRIIKISKDIVGSQLPIIAGTGTNATLSTIKTSLMAKEAGADACLIVTPYYNKPTQKGMLAHFAAIAKQVALPIILYNVPSRTACDILPETVAELSLLPNIVGIKEATGKSERLNQLKSFCASDFALLSGDDPTASEWMQSGAHGVISVTANIAPAKMVALANACLAGDYDQAKTIDARLSKLHHCLFLESNPIPTKWVLNLMDKIPAGIRLPLLTLDKKYHYEVKEALMKAGVDFKHGYSNSFT